MRLLRPLKAEGLHKRPAHSSAGNVGQWRHLLAEMTSSGTEVHITVILLGALEDSELGETTGLVFDLLHSSHVTGKQMGAWSRGLTGITVEELRERIPTG